MLQDIITTNNKVQIKLTGYFMDDNCINKIFNIFLNIYKYIFILTTVKYH